MLSRHGTRLEIGTADDVVDLDEMEAQWHARGSTRSEQPSHFRMSESPAAMFDDTTPKPSRRVHAQYRTSSTPPPPPQL
ncbi:Hypothetical protein, putative [Bodo saltans]|uniref:Uncharacterized protein n=1 Tax=Bodo saltans TaxID=75058 RepID=A0A0S4IUU7_BODSA|nr:Hypothetical protein, putative [Bodo saltans]|eukprot:CUF96006.1 Hypothetical protein, putative [Bodo saltans]